MLKNKIKCLIIEFKVVKDNVIIKYEIARDKINGIIDKVVEYVDSTSYGKRLKHNVNRMVKGIGVVLLAIGNQIPMSVLANTEDLATVGVKIRTIFDPIVEMLASLGYPTAYMMLILGGLMVITGRKAKGLEIIKWACVGYIGLQLVPFVLVVLEMIGKSLRGSL